jgi:hypothetical protein
MHDDRFPCLLPEILHFSGEFYSKLYEVTPSDSSDARAKREMMRSNALAQTSVFNHNCPPSRSYSNSPAAHTLRRLLERSNPLQLYSLD